jgi:hypothetical protein
MSQNWFDRSQCISVADVEGIGSSLPSPVSSQEVLGQKFQSVLKVSRRSFRVDRQRASNGFLKIHGFMN